ncbi:MAG: hypothetical protein ACE5FZ_05025 [Nitrospiria bacterium]
MPRYFAMMLTVFSLWIFSGLVPPHTAFAHGVVGKRLFVEPIAVEDANIFSELDLIVPRYTRGEEEKELEIGSSFTFQLTKNLGLEIEGEWVNRNPPTGPKLTGLSHLEAVLKYVAYVNPKREWIFTVALTGETSIGDDDVRENDFNSFGTGVFYGKGFGDLPEWAKYFRPLMLQGDFIVHHPIDSDSAKISNTLSYDFAIYYSIPYLQQFVKDVGIPAPFSRLFPMMEFTSERVLNGPGFGQREVFALPGLMWVGKSYQVGVAAVIPMNKAARDEVDTGVTGIISLYMDDLFPKQFKDPLL